MALGAAKTRINEAITLLTLASDHLSMILPEDLSDWASQFPPEFNAPERLNEILDLFPETDRRLVHIKEDIEDLQAGKPFRHEELFLRK